MKKRLFTMAFVLAWPFFAQSQYYNYVPNSINVPYMAQKGDVNIRIGWGRGASFQALELQGVYSPVSHLAVMANYFNAPEKTVRNKIDRGTDAHFWEIAVGAYERFSKGSASLFAGYGSGRIFSNYEDNAPDLNAKLGLRRWFLQPGLAYRSNSFYASLALRLSRLEYANGLVSFSIDPYYLSTIQNAEKNAPMFLPEIGLQAGIRLQPVTVGMSITSIFPNTENMNFARLNANVSLGVEFGTIKKRN